MKPFIIARRMPNYGGEMTKRWHGLNIRLLGAKLTVAPKIKRDAMILVRAAAERSIKSAAFLEFVMHPENKEKLERRIIQAAHAALEEQKYVSAVDIFLRLGWLMPSPLKDWRLGKLDYLERRIQANLKKISSAIKF